MFYRRVGRLVGIDTDEQRVLLLPECVKHGRKQAENGDESPRG
jgi:hypothetical protein